MNDSAQRDDKAEIEALITTCYEIVSGPAGPRDWSRQSGIFHPDSRQMRTGLDDEGRPTMQAFSPDEYAKNAGPVLAKMDFYEVALVNKIEVFGNIAQAWSSYIARHHPDDTEAERRGINAFLFNRGADGKWQIVSMIWDNEREGLALPATMTGAVCSMRITLVILGLLAAFLAPNFFRAGWGGAAVADVSEHVEEPRLVAAMFRSSWCSACRIIEPRVEDVRAEYEHAAIDWVKFDFTLGRRDALREMAEAEGLLPIYDEAAGSTGFMLLIDRDTNQVFEMVTMDYGRDQIRETLDRWLRVVERLEAEGA